jgi:hypothetical protein
VYVAVPPFVAGTVHATAFVTVSGPLGQILVLVFDADPWVGGNEILLPIESTMELLLRVMKLPFGSWIELLVYLRPSDVTMVGKAGFQRLPTGAKAPMTFIPVASRVSNGPLDTR